MVLGYINVPSVVQSDGAVVAAHEHEGVRVLLVQDCKVLAAESAISLEQQRQAVKMTQGKLLRAEEEKRYLVTFKRFSLDVC